MKAKDLKNSILQMAVRGELVQQDPNDEPASALLERVRTERAKLIKEKRIKAPKGGESVIYLGSDGSRYEKRVDAKGRGSEPVCIDEEIPFDIPEGWEWARLGSVVYQRAQIRPTTRFSYIDIGSIDNTHQRLNETETLVEADKAPSRARKPVELGDILYSTVRPYLHNMCIVDREFSLMPIASTGFAAMVCHDGLLNTFLFNFLLSPDFDAYANRTDNSKGVAYPAINDKRLYAALVPIPPLAEQRHIAERVSELMPLVEEYGKLEDERETLDAALPERLRKSMLQMAVQGKLVPQDPSDKPASVLLERIREERAKLIKEKKIKAPKGGESVIYLDSDGRRYEKRGKAEPVCIDEEIPFDIPEGWEWARLGNLLSVVSDGTHKTPEYKDKGVLFLSVQNISKGFFDLSKVKYISQETHAELCKRVKPQNGDILLCRIGTLGKPIIVNVDYEFSIFVSLGLLRPIDQTFAEWIVTCIDSPLGFDWIQTVKVGGGTHTFKINLGDIPSFLIPIPPLAEQRRIVAQLDNLLATIA